MLYEVLYLGVMLQLFLVELWKGLCSSFTCCKVEDKGREIHIVVLWAFAAWLILFGFLSGIVAAAAQSPITSVFFFIGVFFGGIAFWVMCASPLLNPPAILTCRPSQYPYQDPSAHCSSSVLSQEHGTENGASTRFSRSSA